MGINLLLININNHFHIYDTDRVNFREFPLQEKYLKIRRHLPDSCHMSSLCFDD
jgi:hypothetical protein